MEKRRNYRMKQAVIINGKKHVLNFDRDARLYSAPRGGESGSSAMQRGKDIYYHRTGKDQGYYYLHQWTLFPDEMATMMILPDRQAERFLGERGLECRDIPGLKAYTTLRNWGYGILEEF
jgi:hypothetical protein